MSNRDKVSCEAMNGSLVAGRRGACTGPGVGHHCNSRTGGYKSHAQGRPRRACVEEPRASLARLAETPLPSIAQTSTINGMAQGQAQAQRQAASYNAMRLTSKRAEQSHPQRPRSLRLYHECPHASSLPKSLEGTRDPRGLSAMLTRHGSQCSMMTARGKEKPRQCRPRDL